MHPSGKHFKHDDNIPSIQNNFQGYCNTVCHKVKPSTLTSRHPTRGFSRWFLSKRCLSFLAWGHVTLQFTLITHKVFCLEKESQSWPNKRKHVQESSSVRCLKKGYPRRPKRDSTPLFVVVIEEGHHPLSMWTKFWKVGCHILIFLDRLVTSYPQTEREGEALFWVLDGKSKLVWTWVSSRKVEKNKMAVNSLFNSSLLVSKEYPKEKGLKSRKWNIFSIKVGILLSGTERANKTHNMLLAKKSTSNLPCLYLWEHHSSQHQMPMWPW